MLQPTIAAEHQPFAPVYWVGNPALTLKFLSPKLHKRAAGGPALDVVYVQHQQGVAWERLKGRTFSAKRNFGSRLRKVPKSDRGSAVANFEADPSNVRATQTILNKQNGAAFP